LAVPFIPPSGKEHTFSISHVLFSFSLKNMWISRNNSYCLCITYKYKQLRHLTRDIESRNKIKSDSDNSGFY